MPRYRIKSEVRAKRTLRFKVRNKEFDETENAVGQCWPNKRHRIIEIDPRQSPKDYMDTLIHEALHELLPAKREDWILKASTSLANLLWRLGYRRVKKRH